MGAGEVYRQEGLEARRFFYTGGASGDYHASRKGHTVEAQLEPPHVGSYKGCWWPLAEGTPKGSTAAIGLKAGARAVFIQAVQSSTGSTNFPQLLKASNTRPRSSRREEALAEGL